MNYNLLPGRTRSYAEQMGLTWFWAYKLRSIKVALNHVRNNPLRALLLNAGSPALPDLPGISVGSPLTDNMMAVTADGRFSYSVGIGMLFNAPDLTAPESEACHKGVTIAYLRTWLGVGGMLRLALFKHPATAIRFWAMPTVIFVVLALPALLVVKEVQRTPGTEWAISIAFMTLFLFAMSGERLSARLALAALAGIFAFANAALSTSFKLQGTPFNDAFFAHLDLSTLEIAWQTNAPGLAALVGYVLLAPAMVYAVLSHQSGFGIWMRRFPSVLKLGFAGLSIWLFYPLSALIYYHSSHEVASERLLQEIVSIRSKKTQIDLEGSSKHNLVLIYLESVEETYFDETLFAELLPNLGRLRDRAMVFSDMRQYPGTSWTMGGLVSSQCGVPLLSESDGNSIMQEADNPFAHVKCLAEYLRDEGYKSAFIGGASLTFAGKGNFLRDNGYDVQLGIDELPTPGHSWGMYDADMLEHATSLFDGLANGDSPFLLTVLTLDTHHPDGYPSPTCKPYDVAIRMLNAVHCTDQLIGSFVKHIQDSAVAEDTVIAIMSDHLLISGEIEEALETRDRRLLLFVLGPELAPQKKFGAASHFDVAPTLLEAVGLRNAEFPFGQSLLSHDIGFAIERNLTEDDFLGFKVETLVAADVAVNP